MPQPLHTSPQAFAAAALLIYVAREVIATAAAEGQLADRLGG